MDLNKVILIGRLTAEPELKQTASGVSVINFTIAVNRKYKQDGEKIADFINVIAWKERAEFVSKYFSKGNPICICGEIQTRKWKDKNGENRYATEINASEVNFVESKTNKHEDSNQFEEVADENLPF